MGSETIHGYLRASLLIVATGLLGCAQPSRADQPILDRPIAAFYSNREEAFDAILRFGRENSIPLGLVLNRQACSIVLDYFRVEHASVQTVLEEFAKRLPSYHWKLEDGVVIFAPDNIPQATADFFALRPPPYAIPEETLQAQVLYAWMNVRASLKPNEGTALNILSSPKSEKWPALTLNNLTVRQVLNRLISRKAAGAWVLVPFEDLIKAADRRPFWVTGYSDYVPERASSLCLSTQNP